MNNSWKSLSFRLSLIIVVTSVVPLLIFGLLTISHSKATLLETQQRATRRATELVAAQVEQSLEHFIHSLKVSAENLDLLSLTADDLEWALMDVEHQHEEILGLTLLDVQGQERARVSVEQVFMSSDLVRREDSEVLRKIQAGENYIGHVTVHAGSGYECEIGVPLFDSFSHELAGALIAEVQLQTIFAPITDIMIGKQGGVSLIDAEGTIIAHHDASLLLVKKKITMPGAEQRLAARTGIEMLNAVGERVQASIVPIDGTNWSLFGQRMMSEIEDDLKASSQLFKLLLAALLVLLVPAFYYFLRIISRPLKAFGAAAVEIGRGRLDVRIAERGSGEIAMISREFNVMAENLEKMTAQREQEEWYLGGLSQLDEHLRDTSDLISMANGAVSHLAQYINAQVAAIYLWTNETHYKALAGYAHQGEAAPAIKFSAGEGLVGQAGHEKRMLVINDVPEHYLDVSSGLGHAGSEALILMPLLFNDELIGVMEFGAFAPFPKSTEVWLQRAAGPLATALSVSRSRDELRKALSAAQKFAEQLQVQQEELQAANEEMEEQSMLLKTQQEELQASNTELENQAEKLKASEEELQASNEELEEKSQSLRLQHEELQEKNQTLEETRHKLINHAKQLKVASQYKSEFLANMSHELRTPLNSLLILSQNLAGNRDGNLTEEQVESAEVIYNSGQDLLTLINDILDLSKIEAGKMELRHSLVDTADLQGRLLRNFQHVASKKDLVFEVRIEETVPEQIETDLQRLEQVLKNLISNAMKFTQHGSVTVEVASLSGEQRVGLLPLAAEEYLAIRVIDTGIGIPEDKLDDIFGAFQQLDGSLSRQFSGTGLGLTISRDLASLIGGELHVASQQGVGSTFTLYLPKDVKKHLMLREEQVPPKQVNPPVSPVLTTAENEPPVVEQATADKPAPKKKRNTSLATIADDREEVNDQNQATLIIEDDLKFARILANECRKKGLLFLHAADGETGLELAEAYAPAAILLDIRLPMMDGIKVLECLKNSTRLRHIPVHVISAEDHSHDVLSKGAVCFLSKPASQEDLAQVFEKMGTVISGVPRRLLIVEDDDALRKSVVKLIGNGDVKSVEAETGEQAYACLEEGGIDCVILDLSLPDMTGFELLEKLEANNISLPPVIIYTGRDLSLEEEETLYRYSSSIIIKGVRSPERLLDEASLFLHRVISKLPAKKQKIISNLHDGSPLFVDRKVLLVDDDMRNVFALGKILEQHGLKVVKAANGIKALEMLDTEKNIDLVLMDIMMPVMDGLEATRRIRAQDRFKGLPILALTAKAMQEDRTNCLEAGANDYLSKPIDIDQLLSLLRVWLYR